MTVENYALGHEKSEESFCRWMEYKTLHLGSIRGGSARKLIIYKHKGKPGWYHDPAYPNVQEAWQAIREAYIRAFELAQAGDFSGIDHLEPLQGGPALLLKVLHLYFPKDILPVYSKEHIQYFLHKLGSPAAKERGWGIVRLNRSLLAALQMIA
jgi:5-methylcytosine-specific restriction protein B